MNLLTHLEELSEVGTLICDLSKFPIDEFNKFENPTTGRPYFSAHCRCKAVLSESVLTIEILWNEVQLCKIEIDHE